MATNVAPLGHPRRTGQPGAAALTAIHRVQPLVVVAGLVALTLSAVLTWAALVVDHNSNTRLLQIQVKETAVALSLSEVPTELADALQVAAATSSPTAFDNFAADKVAPGQLANVSLWRRNGATFQLLAHVGPIAGVSNDAQVRTFLSRVHPDAELQVSGVLPGDPRHVGFAEMAPGDHDLVVFAEGDLPPTSYRIAVPKSSPFASLNFALYLGSSPRASQLIEATASTPLRGATARASVPFGDSEVTLVGTANADLAGGFTAALPWVVLGVGLVLTIAGASTLEYALRRRGAAEVLAAGAAALAAENNRLYLEQRNIAATLQHALLPELPQLDALEMAARYVPGTAGVDVGGDWFDVICSDEARCVVIVGDVSGRGLRAAKVMAAMRYGARAYVAEDDAPEVVLRKLGRTLSFEADHQFATMLICELDVPGRRVTLASAAHLPPLLLADHEASFVDVPVACPVGVDETAVPRPVTIEVPKGAMLLAFTDGLVERRRENLDVGLERLRAAAVHEGGPVERIVDAVVAQLLPQGSEDDVVVVGVRWRT